MLTALPAASNTGEATYLPVALSVELETLPEQEHLPLMIRWSNWRPEFGPAFVYAREQDLEGMLAMDDSDESLPVIKMLMVASYDETSRLMQRADELHAAGVTIVGLNTENGPGMTPPEEMETLFNPDPNVNVVARVAQLATENGFSVMWGPIRNVTDRVSDDVIRTIITAGVRGLAMQEQKFIETQPAQERAQAVIQTRDRYLTLARDMSVDDFSFHVQIMHQRCPDLDNCVEFVRLLEAIPVNSIAIWSNGPIPLEFVEAIRGY
jgi:hypothetical protein